MEKTGKSELLVAALQNGTVIDHIPSDKVFDVVNLLGLTGISNPITIGSNLSSRKMGSKGIIKIADRYFTEEECGKLGKKYLASIDDKMTEEQDALIKNNSNKDVRENIVARASFDRDVINVEGHNNLYIFGAARVYRHFYMCCGKEPLLDMSCCFSCDDCVICRNYSCT